MIKINQLGKEYPGASGPVHALTDISVDVNAGEYVVLRGPSGCGKTTLLLAAGGLLRPTAGTVRVIDQDVWSLSSAARAALRARHIGYVFQQFHLVPYLTLRENVIAPALTAPLAGAEKRADMLIEQLGLSSRATHLPAQLSTGERQRCALARALLQQPELLLADEPTGNLDEASARIVIACLRDYVKTGHAVLIATHDDRAAAQANRELRLLAGRRAN